MRVPDNLDFFEMYEREEERRIRRMNQLELEEELGFKTVDEANKEEEDEQVDKGRRKTARKRTGCFDILS